MGPIGRPLGNFFVASVYGPNFPLERANLWKTLNNNLLEGEWLIGRDFNVIEKPSDSTTQASLIKGIERDEWHAFSYRFDIVDLFNLLGGVETPNSCGEELSIKGKLVKSWLDKIYCSLNG